MADATTISVLIKARDEASKAFKNVENNAGQMAQGIAKHRRTIGVGMLGMGAAITGIGVLMAKSAATFDASMREVNSLIGLSATEFEKLKKETLDMSAAIGVDAVESSQALYQAISAGVPRDNVIDFMTIASKAAIAGVTSTEVAVDGLTTVMNAFKMPMSEAQRVADIMFVSVKGGKTTFEELGAAMQYVAPIAAALNVPFEEIGAAAATMTKQGIPTKMAFTALRQTFVSLMKPTAEMETALDQVGFATGRALLDAHGLQGGLQLLTTGTNLTEAEMTKAFGSVEAFGAVLALTGQNATEAANDLAKSYDHMGAATDAFNIINEGAARQMEILKARLGVVSIELGNILLPILIAVMQKVSELTTSFMEFYREHPTLVKWLGIIALGVGALLVVLGSLLLLLPTLSAGFVILSASMGPITAVIMGLTAVIAGGILIWNNWDNIVNAVKKTLAFFAQSALDFARDILVAIKAVADFIPGLKDQEDALQGAIDKLDNMSDGLDRWANNTEARLRETSDAWGAMEDSYASNTEQMQAHMKGTAIVSEWTGNAVVDVQEKIAVAAEDMARDSEIAWEDMAIASGNAWGAIQDDWIEAEKAMQESAQRNADSVAYFAKLNLDTERAARNESRENFIKSVEDGLADAARRQEQHARILEREVQDAERAADQKADAAARSLERQLSSWERFEQDQNPIMKALNEQNKGFGDVLKLLAEDAGKSLGEMGEEVKKHGITWGDTFALIEHDVSKSLAELLGDIESTAAGAALAAEKVAAGITGAGEPGAHMGGGSISADQISGAVERWNAAMPHSPVGESLMKTIENVQKHGGDFADFAGTRLGQIMQGIEGTDTGIPGAANGGMVRRGGMALVGERGAELVSLPGGSTVHPNGTGGGVTNQFHFHGAVYGVEDLKEAVVEAVRDHAISGGFSGVFAEA